MGTAATNSAGYGRGILQEVLFELLSDGISPKRYVVSRLVSIEIYTGNHYCLCPWSSLCCAYLAFKVDEYNLTLDQFVHMLAPHLVQSTTDFILSHEVS